MGGIKDIEVRVNIASTFDDSGLRDAESRAAALAAIGFTGQPTIDNPVDSNSDPAARDFFDTQTRIPRFAEGTPFVPFTGLAMVHQGERITPASQNRSGAAAGNVTQTIIFQNVEDPNEQKRMLDRVNRQMLNDMRRQ